MTRFCQAAFGVYAFLLRPDTVPFLLLLLLLFFLNRDWVLGIVHTWAEYVKFRLRHREDNTLGINVHYKLFDFEIK